MSKQMCRRLLLSTPVLATTSALIIAPSSSMLLEVGQILIGLAWSGAATWLLNHLVSVDA